MQISEGTQNLKPRQGHLNHLFQLVLLMEDAIRVTVATWFYNKDIQTRITFIFVFYYKAVGISFTVCFLNRIIRIYK